MNRTGRSLVHFGLPLLVLAALQGCFTCGPCACPAASITLAVSGAPDGGAVADTHAFIVELGEGTGSGQCTPSTVNPETDCFWYAGNLDAGSYTIRVSAPGFQTLDVPASVSRFEGCCAGAQLTPNQVVLTPGDGGN